MNKDINLFVKKIRNHLNISSIDFAAHIGIYPVVYRYLERGYRSYAVSDFSKVAKFLNIDADILSDEFLVYSKNKNNYFAERKHKIKQTKMQKEMLLEIILFISDSIGIMPVDRLMDIVYGVDSSYYSKYGDYLTATRYIKLQTSIFIPKLNHILTDLLLPEWATIDNGLFTCKRKADDSTFPAEIKTVLSHVVTRPIDSYTVDNEFFKKTKILSDIKYDL